MDTEKPAPATDLEYTQSKSTAGSAQAVSAAWADPALSKKPNSFCYCCSTVEAPELFSRTFAGSPM